MLQRQRLQRLTPHDSDVTNRRDAWAPLSAPPQALRDEQDGSIDRFAGFVDGSEECGKNVWDIGDDVEDDVHVGVSCATSEPDRIVQQQLVRSNL